MIHSIPRLVRCCSVATGIMIAGILPGLSQDGNPGLRRTQEIPLNAGWNAVFLEVQPSETAPAAVFSGLPVDKVATLFENPVTNQFVTDPGVDLFKGHGWGVWYAPGLPEAFLKSLDAIDGNRAYLVHAKSACRWQPTGEVALYRPTWRPDAYNFVGFSVRATGGPTFAQFFAGSKAHRDQTIYRLVDGRWKKVLQPGSENMRSGEAFCYCKGSSGFQGPLTVETPSRQGLLLANTAVEVVLRNQCPHPLKPTLTHMAGQASPLPLSILVRALGDPSAPVTPVAARMPVGPWQQAMPPLEVGASIAVPFECRSGEMLSPQQGSILKITTDLGTETWLPVLGFRKDLGQ